MLALQALIVVAIATVLGIGSAWLAVDREIAFDTVRVGSWTAWPRAGEADADPYVRAGLAASGQLPLTISEGLTFTARTDAEGRPLEAGCEYRVSGRMPAARWWTVTIYREDDFRLIANLAERQGFDSSEVLRRSDGAVEIVVAPSARPGNWLPMDPSAGRLRIVLRLYDTPLSIGGAVADAELPEIERGACR